MLKKLVTGGILLIFIGSIGCMITYKGYSEQYLSNDVYSQQYSAKGVDNIVLNSPNWVNIDIEIMPTDSDTIQIDGKYADNIMSIASNDKNGVVTIEFESKRPTNMGMFHRGTDNKIVVGIPKNYRGDITVGGGLSVTMNYLDVNSIYLTGGKMPVVNIQNSNIKNEVKSNTNANVRMTNSTAKNIDIVGWGTFTNVTTDNLSIDSDTNAYVELTDVDVKNDIYVDGGEVHITDVRANGMKLYSQYGRKVLTDVQINNDIVIKNGNGEIVLSDISSNNIEIDNKNGSVSVEDLATSQLIVDAKNGDVNILQSETVTSRIRNEYGKIQIDDLTGNVEVDNKNGNVTVERGVGDIDIYNKYGNVKIDRPEINDNVTIDNKNGNVNMSINANRSKDVGFDINVSNGNISDEDMVKGLKKDGNKKVRVNVGYGNFNLD